MAWSPVAARGAVNAAGAAGDVGAGMDGLSCTFQARLRPDALREDIGEVRSISFLVFSSLLFGLVLRFACSKSDLH